MRKLVLAAALLALAVPAASSAAVERSVAMKFNRLTPTFRVALVGDTVRWTNSESTTTIHNIVGSFGSSGEMLPGTSWVSAPFGAPGSYSYVCTHHPATMRGTVFVDDLYLSGPTAVLRHGAAARFTGYAPESQQVVMLRNGTQVGSTTAGADGAFSITVPMATPGTYQAVAGAAQSSARVRVRPRLGISARRSGRRLVVTVAATPSQARARVVVERRQGSRWVRLARGRLNSSSKATFRVARRAMQLRARTTSAVGGYERATSRTIRVR